jgi:hypothetical protein
MLAACSGNSSAQAVGAVNGDDGGSRTSVPDGAAPRLAEEAAVPGADGGHTPVEAAVDRTPPTIKFGSPSSPLHLPYPSASEPLALGATFRLVGNPSLEFTPDERDGAIVGFSPVEKKVLPFSGVWKAVAMGFDLAGLPVLQPADFETVADPGIFPQDGFDSATGDDIATVIGSLPMTGAAALVRNSKLLHIDRAAGKDALHFTARLLVSAEHGYPATGHVSVGVIGGTRSDQALSFDDQPIATGDGEWKYASNAVDGSLVLTETGSDVVVEFTPPSVSPGPASCVSAENLHCFTRAALLIDDVRVE